MINKMIRVLVISILAFSACEILMAQEVGLSSAVNKPIVCKWTTLHGMEYYVSKHKVTGQDLKQIIYSENDLEATKLLKLSEDSETFGWIGVGSGSALLLTGVIGANQSSNPSAVNGWAFAAIGGVVLDLAGALLLEQGRTSQFAAVQRYNQVARGETDMSWNQSWHSQQSLLAWGFKF